MPGLMFDSLDDALAHSAIANLRVEADFQHSPFDTRCFLAAFYLAFDSDEEGLAVQDERLCVAAFVAHPACSAAFNKAYRHGEKYSDEKEGQELMAALNFIHNDEVNCMFADPGLVSLATRYDARLESLPKAAADVRGQELLPRSVHNLHTLMLAEIEALHTRWNKAWAPVFDRPVFNGGIRWFF